jgi:AcrR family transcriptional regulator
MTVGAKQAKRLTRAERSERNRSRVLGAAREVFLERGYHGATVEQIADAAGFSTGVVYSQFGGKADLFLALLTERIEDRIREHLAFVDSLDDGDGVARFVEHSGEVTFAQPEWGLLVLEFRVHAARDPELNRRYAEAHARTVAGLEDALARAARRSGGEGSLAPGELAEVLAAFASGAQLERAAGRDALAGGLIADVFRRLVT